MQSEDSVLRVVTELNQNNLLPLLHCILNWGKKKAVFTKLLTKTQITRQQKPWETFSVHPFYFSLNFFLFLAYEESVHKHSEPSGTCVFYLYYWIHPAAVHSYG